MLLSRLALALSDDTSFRSAYWTDPRGWGRATLKAEGLTPGRAVALRKAAIAALPPRMVAAIRRLRGTSDYAGACQNAVDWLSASAKKGTRVALKNGRAPGESARVAAVRAIFATLS